MVIHNCTRQATIIPDGALIIMRRSELSEKMNIIIPTNSSAHTCRFIRDECCVAVWDKTLRWLGGEIGLSQKRWRRINHIQSKFEYCSSLESRTTESQSFSIRLAWISNVWLGCLLFPDMMVIYNNIYQTGHHHPRRRIDHHEKKWVERKKDYNNPNEQHSK